MRPDMRARQHEVAIWDWLRERDQGCSKPAPDSLFETTEPDGAATM